MENVYFYCTFLPLLMLLRSKKGGCYDFVSHTALYTKAVFFKLEVPYSTYNAIEWAFPWCCDPLNCASLLRALLRHLPVKLAV